MQGAAGATAPAASLTPEQTKAVEKAKQAAIDSFVNGALTAIDGDIRAGAALANDEDDARNQITAKANEAALSRVKAAVDEAVSRAIGDRTFPDENAVVAAVKEATDSLTKTLPEDAKNAAKAAATAKAKALAGKRTAVLAGDVNFSYKTPTASPTAQGDVPPDGKIKSPGPDITFTADVTMKVTTGNRKFNDSKADVKLELKPHSDANKAYLDVSPVHKTADDNGSNAALSIQTLEAGTYDLVVTVTPTDGSVIEPLVKTVEIDATTAANPTIETLAVQQDDRQVTFDLKGSSTIEVRSGRLIVGAKVDVVGRNLALLDVGADVALKTRGGVPAVTTAAEATKANEIRVVVPDADLTDKPMRIAAVDLWSHETSEAITLVIPAVGGGLPSQTVGISGKTGENAVFAEYTRPRTVPDGFKPSDKVDTRTVRLYYYRDAHRVAQIVNRDVRSHNRVAVDTRRRMADKARGEADGLTDARRIEEIDSIRKAQAARAAEHKVRQAQDDLDAALRAERQARSDVPQLDAGIAQSEQADADLKDQIDDLNAQLATAKAQGVGANAAEVTRLKAMISATQFRRNQETARRAALTQKKSDAQAAIDGKRSQSAQAALDAARTAAETARLAEGDASVKRVRDEQLEDRARENQFRQEVAAAHEDPDTYVAGKPTSDDPVLQVSVSVIGEGLIQLRGPMKGINVIRTMINEIDAPTSQVRVGIHTVQINGEHGDRIEKVATRIQDYIDHSRFLTAQSAQMLRNAVVKVAGEKAHEAAASCPNVAEHRPGVACPDDTQAARDARYQEAFFGCDFINELREIDSEFLMTGNKLLSLHSMDTTSLASALFLLALAKNEVREQILAEFQNAMQVDLPAAESNYYSAGAVGRAKDHHNEFKLFACNAKFQSFLGFFNAQVAGSDTLNPLQREFLKLAQIFKSRLVTELEYKQRVTERGLLEDRIDPILDRKKAREAETKAQEKLIETLGLIQGQRGEASRTLLEIQSNLADLQAAVSQARSFANEYLPLTKADEVNPDLPVSNRVDQINNIVTSTKAHDHNSIPNIAKSIAPERERDLQEQNNLDNITSNYVLMFGSRYKEKLEQSFSDRHIKELKDKASTISKQRGAAETNNNQSATATELVSQESDKGIKFHVTTVYKQQKNALDVLWKFRFSKADWDDYLESYKEFKTIDLNAKTPKEVREIAVRLSAVAIVNNRLLTVIQRRIVEIRQSNDKLFGLLSSSKPVTHEIITAWQQVKAKLTETIREQRPANGPAKDDDSSEATDSDGGTAAAAGVSKRTNKSTGSDDKSLAKESQIDTLDNSFKRLFTALADYDGQLKLSDISRRRLDQKRLLDMLIDDVEDKYIELLEGTRSHTANIDAYIKSIATALDDDFNTQFYYPAFTEVRRSSRFHDVQLGKIETTNVLANNRGFGKVEPQATMEFDLPKRDILINEAMNGALAMTKDFGALVNDPTFLSMAKLRSGQPTSSLTPGAGEGVNTVRNALPGLSRADDEQLFSQQGAGRTQFGSAMEALIPDPAVYKFETGTGFEIRPVVQPDGQSVVFHFNYMYTTNVREPVRADEKHLGRVKRHFIDTDVQLGNYELREVSRYQVALKASRTSRGVPLFEDIPALGVLFRPLPSAESSLQENIVLGQGTIFPTLFDLMGLRWAPAVADLDTLRLRNDNFVVRGRYRDVQNRVFDISTSQVDDYLQVPPSERRADLYRTQQTIPDVHPNGYRGPGLNYQDTRLREGYDPAMMNPERGPIPGESRLANPRGPAPGTDAQPMIEGELERELPMSPGEARNTPRSDGRPPTQVAVRPPSSASAPGRRAPVVSPARAPATPASPRSRIVPSAAPSSAPAVPRSRVAPPASVPPLSGPATTNWQRSTSDPSPARMKDPAVLQSSYNASRAQPQPQPRAQVPDQPKRRGLFSQMLGTGR